nr:hypothetical protein [Planktotalea sp.]
MQNPDTDQRKLRLNPEPEWVVTDIPTLRIVGQTLWGTVKIRKGALITKDTNTNI